MALHGTASTAAAATMLFGRHVLRCGRRRRYQRLWRAIFRRWGVAAAGAAGQGQGGGGGRAAQAAGRAQRPGGAAAAAGAARRGGPRLPRGAACGGAQRRVCARRRAAAAARANQPCRGTGGKREGRGGRPHAARRRAEGEGEGPCCTAGGAAFMHMLRMYLMACKLAAAIAACAGWPGGRCGAQEDPDPPGVFLPNALSSWRFEPGTVSESARAMRYRPRSWQASRRKKARRRVPACRALAVCRPPR